jgi:hypothetical protein
MTKKAESKKPKSAQSAALVRMTQEIFDLRTAKQLLEARMDRFQQELEVKFAAIQQVSDLFITLRRVLNNASAELAGAASYTQQEISRMSAEDYREKVLVPLNMGRRV